MAKWLVSLCYVLIPSGCHLFLDPINVTVTFLDAELLENNSVGNEWEVTVDGMLLGGSQNGYLKDIIRITAQVVERDTHDDVGETTLTVRRTEFCESETRLDDSIPFLTFAVPVETTEEDGRYAGNTAVWEVTIRVTRSADSAW